MGKNDIQTIAQFIRIAYAGTEINDCVPSDIVNFLIGKKHFYNYCHNKCFTDFEKKHKALTMKARKVFDYQENEDYKLDDQRIKLIEDALQYLIREDWIYLKIESFNPDVRRDQIVAAKLYCRKKKGEDIFSPENIARWYKKHGIKQCKPENI